MNKHLNIFHTYTKVEREGNQLENDLTRALAVCLQEEPLLLYRFLQTIFKTDDARSNHFEHLFATWDEESDKIEVEIQKRMSTVEGFTHIYAVGLSESLLKVDDFFIQKRHKQNERTTDLFIRVKDTIILVEVKPGKYGLTNQLFNQAMDACEKDISEEEFRAIATPVNLDWSKLMKLVLSTKNFRTGSGSGSRYLQDFVRFIKQHNAKWFPIIPLFSLSYPSDKTLIKQRLEAALSQFENNLEYPDRMGLTIESVWANEVILKLEEKDKKPFVSVGIWPGNTKAQGWSLYEIDNQVPEFKDNIDLPSLGKTYEVKKEYHLKFTNSHGRWITGLNGTMDDFVTPIHTRRTFKKHSGRKKRNSDDWVAFQKFMDDHFKPNINWREQCEFEKRILQKNYSQFNIAFGFELSISIPLEDLMSIDKAQENYKPLKQFLTEVEKEMQTILISKP